MDTISVYTDGSCSYKDRSGGWAYIAIMGERHIEGFGHVDGATTGSMELTAMLKALTRIKHSAHPIRLFSDSEYAVNCVNQWAARWELVGWENIEGQPVANKEIVQQLHKTVKAHKKERSVTVSWIKGHNKHQYNERVDFLAGMARVSKLSSEQVRENGVDCYVFHNGDSQKDKVIAQVDRTTGNILATSHKTRFSTVGKAINYYIPQANPEKGKWSLIDKYPLPP